MVAPTVVNVQVTENDIVNVATEQDLWSWLVPGNTLSTNKALRVTIRCDYLNNSGATRTLQIKIVYGTTTMYDDLTVAIAANAGRYPVEIEFILFPKNATNSQGVSGLIQIGISGAATTGIGDLAVDETTAVTPFVGANASEDSTQDKTLYVKVTHATNHASLSIRRLYACVEKLG